MNQVVDEIADRVRRRMQALRAGKEQPCTTSPGPAAARRSLAAPRNVRLRAMCARTWTAAAPWRGEAGAARIAPESIRTSADIAPYIDHTLLKPEASRRGGRQAGRGGAQARLRHGVRELGARGAGGADSGGLQDGAHRRGGLPARGGAAQRQGLRGPRGHPLRRARDRHGDQHRRAEGEGLRAGAPGHLRGGGGQPPAARSRSSWRRASSPTRRRSAPARCPRPRGPPS